MFVVTMKWNKKAAVSLIVLIAIVLSGLILFSRVDKPSSNGSQRLDSNESRVGFLESLGWQVDSEPLSEKQIVIPKEFSTVYTEYNRLQLAQGYDLSQFCGMEATVYTYAIHNYEGYVGSVVADLYLCDCTVIGGDVHSLALDGFMHGLKKP